MDLDVLIVTAELSSDVTRRFPRPMLITLTLSLEFTYERIEAYLVKFVNIWRNSAKNQHLNVGV